MPELGGSGVELGGTGDGALHCSFYFKAKVQASLQVDCIKGGKPKPPKEAQVWLEREIKVADAVRSQETWRDEMAETFKGLHSSFADTTQECKNTDQENTVAPELKFAAVRMQALGAILGLSDWKRKHDDQPSPALAKAADAQVLTAKALSIHGGGDLAKEPETPCKPGLLLLLQLAFDWGPPPRRELKTMFWDK